jgi:hypothetical protein
MEHPGWSDPDYRFKKCILVLYIISGLQYVQLCNVYKRNTKHKTFN